MIEINKTHKQIIKMWNDGMSSGEIASLLKVSRNSVIGKVSRMRASGIPLRSAPKIKPKLQKVTKRQVKTQRGWIVKRQIRPKVDPTILLDQLFLDIPLPVQRVDILQLTPKSCRYIVDRDPKRGALYCGDMKHYRSYCKKHAELCYVPVRLR